MQSISNLVIDKEVKNSFKIGRLLNAWQPDECPVSVAYNRIFILEGAKGAVRLDQSIYELSGNEVFLIAKGQIFSFLPGTVQTGLEILFGDCFWDRAPQSASNCKAALFNRILPNPGLSLTGSDATDLFAISNMLLQEYDKKDYPNKLDAMAAYLKIIMIKLANIQSSSIKEMNDFDQEIYQSFLTLVSEKAGSTREVADFARELSVSARKLSEVCRSKSGSGAKEIINKALIAEAKRSLQFTVKPVKEIAYHLHFATPEQFSHFFKKYTGVSPADFRHLFVNIGR